MYYVCIENNQVTGIQSYEPAVPSTVSVVTITDQQHQQIMEQTHRFDVASKTVVAVDSAMLAEKEQYRLNGIEREFLNSTDWKILRHMRQKALNVSTTLSEVEFLELEQQRQAAAARIV
jgi:heme A synthase